MEREDQLRRWDFYRLSNPHLLLGIVGQWTYTVYPEILAVIKFGDLLKIWPNALLAEFKFGGLPE